MRRLTISPQACAETLSVLVTFAWADGKLDDREKAGVRGAVEVLNLTKENRDRVEAMLRTAPSIEAVQVDRLSPRDCDFAYVAAAWMCDVDDGVADKEEALLERLASVLGIEGVRKAQLEGVAHNLVPSGGGVRKWSDEVVKLFRSIPPRIEPDLDLELDEEVEVTFE